jgi:hypothetical protein
MNLELNYFTISNFLCGSLRKAPHPSMWRPSQGPHSSVWLPSQMRYTDKCGESLRKSCPIRVACGRWSTASVGIGLGGALSRESRNDSSLASLSPIISLLRGASHPA